MINITENTYLISDTHFGHRRLVDWGRPEDFCEQIISNWNKTIKKDDVVLHLGDFTMVNYALTRKYVHNLKGKKFLILGNHDEHSPTWYKDLGFTVLPATFKNLQNKYGEWESILFTHIPEYDIPDNWFNIHGHLHGNGHRIGDPSLPASPIHYDVSVDVINYCPVKLGEILKKLRAQKRTLPTLRQLGQI